MPTLDELKARFSSDRYATEVTGAEILSAEPRHAVCTLSLRPEHLNAAGTPMGGALFTLADFAFAVAANGFAQTVTVSQSADIHFLAPARGTVLTAEAKCLRGGRTVSLYTVDITDDKGGYVAHVTVSGFTIAQEARAARDR